MKIRAGWFRALVSVVLVCVALVVTTRASAQEAPPAGLPSVVNVGGSGLDGALVTKALERELGVSLRADPNAAARLEVVVTGRRANVTYFSPGKEPVTRAVDLPRDDERAVETIAFLAGNLARDEAGGLLDELRAREAAPPPPPPPPAPTEKPAVAPPKPAPAPPPAKVAKAPDLVETPFNLSLSYPTTLLPNTERRRVHFELGLVYSRIGAIRGLGATLGHLRTEQPSSGVTMALVWNQAGPVRGLQLGGFYTQGRGLLRGISMGGLVDTREGDIQGLQLAGLWAKGGNVTGQMAGLIGLADATDGMQLAGLVTRSTERLRGLQLAGLVGTAKSVTGAQVAGLVATTSNVTGLQFSGITSLAETVTGLQGGLVNVARKVHGLQVGFVNVAEEVDGGALGFVSIAGNGRIQPLAWISGGNGTAANVGVKFVTGYTYSYFGAGHSLTDGRYRVEAGAGGHFSFAGSFFGEAGLAYAHDRETAQPEADPLRQELRYDVRVGADIGRLVSPFIGGGLAQRITGEGADFRGEFSAGVALF